MNVADSASADHATTLKAMLRAERAARLAAGGGGAAPQTLLIEKLKFTITKLRHEQFGQSSERGALLDQLELQLADLEENAAQAETAAQMAGGASKITVPSFERRKPARRPLPEHLPRERIVYPAPATCPCCGESRLRKLGEDVTETLELIPRQWKVIQHVREKFVLPDLRGDHAAAGALAPDRARACRTEAAGPHPVLQVRPAPAAQSPERRLRARGHRSRRIDARRLGRRIRGDADAAGRCDPDARLRGRAHPRRRHHRAGAGQGQDAAPAGSGPMCATTGPFGGRDPPAAVFFYSPDRGGEHPEQHLAGYAGLMQADAYAGFDRLYEAGRKPGPIIEAACWAHGRRKFFDLARLDKAPIAIEAVKRIDVLFAIEREINGLAPRGASARAQRA